MDSYEIDIVRTPETGGKQRSSFTGGADTAVDWLRVTADEIEHSHRSAEAARQAAHRAQAGRDTEDMGCAYPGCVLDHPHTGPAVLDGLRGAGWMGR